MEKEFVPYEPTLELKELGFDEPCLSYSTSNIDASGRTWTSVLVAPTFSQAFRWFREKYGYDVSIIRRTINAYKFEINLLFVEDIDYHFIDFSFNTYEEAELACLKKLIKIVKSK